MDVNSRVRQIIDSINRMFQDESISGDDMYEALDEVASHCEALQAEVNQQE